MTHEQAHKILNRVRDGEAYPKGIIDRALCLTGDLDLHEAMRSTGMAATIPGQGAGEWRSGSEQLVAHRDSRH